MVTQNQISTNQFTIIPKVVESREFIEIATDFSNRLDIVREAISNAYDAKATDIKILFDVIDDYGSATRRARCRIPACRRAASSNPPARRARPTHAA